MIYYLYVAGDQIIITILCMLQLQFECEEGKGDYISNIDEPESCVYIINVKTTKICHHPYLKPPVKKTPVPITCNPLVTTEQYDEYLVDQEGMFSFYVLLK